MGRGKSTQHDPNVHETVNIKFKVKLLFRNSFLTKLTMLNMHFIY